MSRMKPSLPAELTLAVSLFFIALGIDLVALSDFGVSAMLSVAYVVSQLFPRLSYGFCSIVFQLLLLASVCIAKRSLRFEYILSFALSAIFGLFMDFWSLFLPASFSGLGLRILIWLLGIAILSVGLGFALATRLPLMPCDSFPRDMAEHLKIPFRRFKTGTDVSCVSLALILGLFIGGRVIGVGLGTVIYALSFGSLVSFARGRIEAVLSFHPVFLKNFVHEA